MVRRLIVFWARQSFFVASIVVLTILCCFSGSGLQTSAMAGPFPSLFTLNRVEADPNKDYWLSEENGPWMIMACSFSGDQAERQARELVLELRKRYKLPAYMYEKTFDLKSDSAGSPRRYRYQQGERVREVAVLVGDFPAVDDPRAQEILQKIKCYRPTSLEPQGEKSTSLTLAALRSIQQSLLTDDNEKKQKGPMRHAFLTTNPLLPDEYFAPRGVDKFILALNEGYEYNLLNCPGRYSVQVAHFTGEVILDQREIQAIERGEKTFRGSLAEAARKAHELTLALRQKGYEAYEFHDRGASIVTIGSFDSLGARRADGKIELDPRIVQIINTFAAEPAPPVPGVPTLGYKPKTLIGIPFDIQPTPVEVPKRSYAADYVRR
jgi:hypothetical protein